jgi:hypothetical protein
MTRVTRCVHDDGLVRPCLPVSMAEVEVEAERHITSFIFLTFFLFLSQFFPFFLIFLFHFLFVILFFSVIANRERENKG